MAYPEIERLSPNRADSPTHEQKGVVFHHSEISFGEAIALMVDPQKKVSYHVIIADDGTRCTLVPDRFVAWHAGVSNFRGRERCNEFLLGLSFAGDSAAKPLTEDQIASALEWLDLRWKKNGWTIADMTDHRQVAPGRKRDLHPPEWERLKAALAARFTP